MIDSHRLTAAAVGKGVLMLIQFDGPIWFWKGPAPHHFISIPLKESADIKAIQRQVTYGWGMIPVMVRINETEWETALFEKGPHFIVPIKLAVRRAESLSEGDTVRVRVEIAMKLG